MTTPRSNARLAMIAATLIWGATFVVVQEALQDIRPLHLVALRFLLAAVVMTPIAARSGGWRSLIPRRAGISAGVILLVAYALQTGGLLWTTPSASAFLTGTSVLIVPAAAWLVYGARMSASNWLGAGIALTGLAFLLLPGSDRLDLGIGELMTIGCAAGFAAHVLVVERAMTHQRVASFAAQQFWVVGLLAAVSLLVTPLTATALTARVVAAILVTGFLATSAAFLCQLFAQRHISAVEIAVILTFEPVVAAVISVVAGSEPLSFGLVVGGSLVVIGILLSHSLHSVRTRTTPG